MKDKIFEIIIGAFKRKLICSDMVEMNKIAGGIDEFTKAHYMPVIEKQDELIKLYQHYSRHLLTPQFNRKAIAFLLIKDQLDEDIEKSLSELADLKLNIKDK